MNCREHHGKGFLSSQAPLARETPTAQVAIRSVLPKLPTAVVVDSAGAEETIRQFEKVVSEFMIQYPSHTQRFPSLRPGEDVLIASNGQEAVDFAEGPLAFDLILMDVNMPVMDGLMATAAIRRLDHANASIPILAMTGMVFDEDRERCLAAGMNEVIAKPYALQELRVRIEGIQRSEEIEENESVALSS